MRAILAIALCFICVVAVADPVEKVSENYKFERTRVYPTPLGVDTTVVIGYDYETRENLVNHKANYQKEIAELDAKIASIDALEE